MAFDQLNYICIQISFVLLSLNIAVFIHAVDLPCMHLEIPEIAYNEGKLGKKKKKKW